MTPRFSVSDFLAVVNQSLEVSFGMVEVEGEVAEYKVNQQKYVFFSLKDGAGTVQCFMTVWQLRMPIEDGMRVVVSAAPRVTAWGKFSLTVREIRLVGEGDLKRSAVLLREKLAREGLFDDARKRALPRFPTRVAVISSTHAAGYADFMKIAAQRWGGVRFVVAHVKVQGEGAADQAVRALAHCNQLAEPPEVIVILRGGGSADDLASFNDEQLVRAVAASRIPVVTGIGHEVDECLCDLAADRRASTPSHAAELLFPDRQEIVRQVRARVTEAAEALIRTSKEWQKNATMSQQAALDHWRQRVATLKQATMLQQQMIAEYDPDVVLRRGYAIVTGGRGVGEMIEIMTYTTHMKARIEQYEARCND